MIFKLLCFYVFAKFRRFFWDISEGAKVKNKPFYSWKNRRKIRKMRLIILISSASMIIFLTVPYRVENHRETYEILINIAKEKSPYFLSTFALILTAICEVILEVIVKSAIAVTSLLSFAFLGYFLELNIWCYFNKILISS